ncbi:zinc/manganese transport system substrate-binding protein [Loktanella fryxellensis]|uniref:Zinc/manganese transport system substrate-binding protein n=1 Tax=Loktanella fryxellensis TaxID=245187 RepID=A0A1H8JD32_9RHOB|nr:metal ABC transporter substrate-binding protein [Loktanella fryxellensis]SEN78753.1 zinc/manganese transport system substrate-binding protein [Loktanella fryxellensis]
MNRRNFLALTTALVALPHLALAQDRLTVVTSFSVLNDMVSQVGGDRIDVATLVDADEDAHMYQPTPADARSLSDANVVVVNGLGFEGWMDRLIEASGFAGSVIVAVDGIATRDMPEMEGHAGHDHGAFDPHGWQSLANARIYVANIAQGLSAADPAGAEVYAANADAYLAQIDATEAELQDLLAEVPQDRRTVVTSHDAFGYLGDAYGLTFLAPQGLSTESEASAADVATLITQIRAEDIAAVFLENVTDSRLVQQIAAETGATVGGTLYSDALSGPDGPAATYLEMMRHNVATLAAALKP